MEITFPTLVNAKIPLQYASYLDATLYLFYIYILISSIYII